MFLIERNIKIYIWNELHSLTFVKCKQPLILGRSPIRGVREVQNHILEWILKELANTFKKKVSEQKFFMDFLSFYTHNSLENPS